MKLTAWRAALRIARRDALRAKGRSILVLAMIALPVFGVAGADVVFRSADLEPQEKIVRLMGQSDALLSSFAQGMTVMQGPNHREASGADGPREGQQPNAEQKRSAETDPEQLARELLPAGTVLLPVGGGPYTTAASKEGRLGVSTGEADLSDPVWHGMLNVVEGAAPREERQVAASREFLNQSGLRLGDTTTLRGLDDRPYTITAVVERPGELKALELVGRPGALIAPLNRASGQSKHSAGPFGGGDWLVKLPAGAVLDWPKVMELNKYGLAATSRTVVLHPPARSQVPLYVDQDSHGYGQRGVDATALAVVATVAGMALLEIVLLAGPAFAVGARRSRRQLGLLAAGGGDRAHVRSVVLGGGVVLGLAGAVTGVVLATVTVAATRPWVEQLAGRRFGHFELAPVDLLGVAAIGLLTGLLAAIVPAVQASRQDVVEALTGRGSVKPANRKIALLGLLMLGGGAALALLGAASGVGRTTAVLGGSVIAELGMVLCTPMLVGMFGRLGRYLPLSPRLALRDAVRHRGRTAPAVAAVMAAVAGAVAVGIYTTSTDEQARQEYRASAPSGAVKISTGWGPDADSGLLPQLRTAVERSIPDLGPRGDLSEVTYKGDCRTGGTCGRVELSVPKERRCPAADPDNDTRDLDGAAYQRLIQDPRCVAMRHSAVNYSQQAAVGDAVALHNLSGLSDPAAEAALAAGKAVVFDPLYLKDGKITFDLVEPESEDERGKTMPISRPPKRDAHQVGVDAVLAHSDTPGALAFLTPETATRLGIVPVAAGSVWLPAAVPSSTAEQRANAAVEKLGAGADLRVERGYVSDQDIVALGLTGFAVLVALGAAGIATGLAAADSQRDLATLAAVGAGGGIRRRLSGFQCGVIAAMGAVLGTVCGAVPAVALRKLQQASESASMMPGGEPREIVIAFPWLNIGLTLVVLPVIAVVLAMAFTRSRLVLGRRTA